MKRLKLSALNLSDAQLLSRSQLRNVLGGDDGSSSGSGTLCMGCTTDSECAQVGKGTCQTYNTNKCANKKCCTGWNDC